MLSDLQFGSYLSYRPKAETDAEKDAKKWMYSIKADSNVLVKNIGPMSTTRLWAGHIAKKIADTPLSEILTPDSILVPIPGSGLQQSASLWVPHRLAKELVRAGLGASVMTHIARATAVQKSAFAKPGERPSVKDHYKSFAVAEGNMLQRTSFVLIDDVITKGATLIAAASRLADAFPNSRISGFALLRTMGYHAPFLKLQDPVVGTVSTDSWGGADRVP